MDLGQNRRLLLRDNTHTEDGTLTAHPWPYPTLWRHWPARRCPTTSPAASACQELGFRRLCADQPVRLLPAIPPRCCAENRGLITLPGCGRAPIHNGSCALPQGTKRTRTAGDPRRDVAASLRCGPRKTRPTQHPFYPKTSDLCWRGFLIQIVQQRIQRSNRPPSQHQQKLSFLSDL